MEIDNKRLIEILDKYNFRTDGIEYNDRKIKIVIHTTLYIELWRGDSDLIRISSGPVGSTTDINYWISKDAEYVKMYMNRVMWNDMHGLLKDIRGEVADSNAERMFGIFTPE